jgi:hypothetical protein
MANLRFPEGAAQAICRRSGGNTGRANLALCLPFRPDYDNRSNHEVKLDYGEEQGEEIKQGSQIREQ